MDLHVPYILMECGVDWITATAGGGMRAATLANRGHDYTLERSSEGFQIRSWNWNGYRGESTDGIAWGHREDGTIIRLSGSMAMRHWKSIMVFADNVSRFDLQTTVLDRQMADNHAVLGYGRSAECAMVESGMVKTSLTVSRPEGATLTIGSRSSDRYLRLYDKTAESEGEYPPRSWRWEVEYKGRRAYKVASDLNTARSEPAAAHNRVRAAFESFGLKVAGEGPSFGWRDAGIVHVTDDQRRLEWVKRCIRPVIGRLVEAYDSETLAAALGFTLYPSQLEPGAIEWHKWDGDAESSPL